jgi:hypothetical protein
MTANFGVSVGDALAALREPSDNVVYARGWHCERCGARDRPKK